MKIEVDPDDAFKAVIEDLDSSRRALQWRNGPVLFVDGLPDKVTQILDAGTCDYRGIAEVVAGIIKEGSRFRDYLEDYGVKIEIVES